PTRAASLPGSVSGISAMNSAHSAATVSFLRSGYGDGAPVASSVYRRPPWTRWMAVSRTVQSDPGTATVASGRARRRRGADVAEKRSGVVQAIGQTLEFRLLGPVAAAADGRMLDIASHKQRALLAALLLARGGVVSSDRLIDALWGDNPPPSAHPPLRGLVARLRRTLAEGEEPPLR